jgi:uncharacterized Zn finger protein
MHDWSGYPPYVSVAEKKEKAAKKLKQLQKKMPDIKPVILTGTALARTWWGKSWNKNLERYADYSNRIGRGRSYVRHGAVLDLRVEKGTVAALIQGSVSKPYQVTIHIKPIGTPQWSVMKKQCEGQLKSLQDLLMGQFSKELSAIFLAEGSGLFPTPQEISFDCNCPDWASMCKHVAATLYGIGARLDEDPLLFFTLRGVQTDDLLTEAIQGATAELLSKAAKKSTRSVDDADLSSLFGIDLDIPPVFAKKSEDKMSITVTQPPQKNNAPTQPIKRKKNLSIQSKASKHPTQTTKHSGENILTSKPVKKSLSRTRKSPLTPIEQVEALIAQAPNGVNAITLSEKTGIAKVKIYALLQRLKQQKKIENKARGIYVKKTPPMG